MIATIGLTTVFKVVFGSFAIGLSVAVALAGLWMGLSEGVFLLFKRSCFTCKMFSCAGLTLWINLFF